MRFVGIDPGLSGAICVIDSGTVLFFDTPTLAVKSGKKTKNIMDVWACVDLLEREANVDNGDVCVVLEKVAAMPGQGVSSMFNFGMGYGIWQGILAALKLPHSLVHSATWKTKLMRDFGKEKDASIVRAKQLYPQAAWGLTRKKDDGRADALLLAHYGKVYLTEADRNTSTVQQEAPTLF